MKVFDLRCAAGHEFEGWFASEREFLTQRKGKEIACPVCGDTHVVKKLSAPRLNLGHGLAPKEAATAPNVSAGGSDTAEGRNVATIPSRAVQAAWLKAVREVIARTEDVGERFAEEARRMHYGEIEERGIRGQASLAETRELLDEGIPVAPLPLPESLKRRLQ